MDQEQASEALAQSTSLSHKKLNAKAPEFVPRSSSSSAAAPPPKAVLQRVYPRPPSFVPAHYGYDNFYRKNVAPFYGYNVSPVEMEVDRNNGGAAAATVENGLSDAHLRILNQVEFYFSDINLATTDQLFRFMSKDPEGYVPLSVVASFKKIKTAINGSSQLAGILQSSKKLLVSEDGKKVKRIHPLAESDMEELQSRIIIAENLPEDHSHQNLMKIFSSVGSVKSIRTCPPQNYNNGTPPGRGDAMHFNGKYHAYVEYESVELAEKAAVELTDEDDWRNGLKVRLLLKSTVKPSQGQANKVGNEGHPIGRKDETTHLEIQCSKQNHSEDSLPQSDSQFHAPQLEDNGRSNPQRKGRHHNHSGGKGKGKGRGWPQHSTNGGSNSRNPGIEVSTSTEKLPTAKAHPVPRMPDGTRGFGVGRGKPVAVRIA